MKVTVNEPVRPSRIFSDVKVGQVCEFKEPGLVLKTGYSTFLSLYGENYEGSVGIHVTVTAIYNIEEVILSKV